MSEQGFPDVRWGRDFPNVRRVVGGLTASKPGAWFIRKLSPLDRRLLERSNGRYTILGPLAVPLLLLTTIGRKTGQRRQIPLLYLREGDRLFLVGSNFGQEHHPAWVGNLIADPKAWVTIGGEEIPVLATELTGAERDRVFELFVTYTSTYAAYRQRTDRQIRLFALTRR